MVNTTTQNGTPMKYYRYTKTVHDKGHLVPITENIYKYVKNKDHDYYRSLYYYDDGHFEEFKKQGAVKGLLGQKTNRLFFDFDIKKNTTIEDAKKDTIAVCNRLMDNGVPLDAIQIYFTGSKGFNVEVETEHVFTRPELENICAHLGKGLSCFDTSMYDENQIVRVPLTKNPKSGFYKIPLFYDDLTKASIAEIIDMARDVRVYDEATLKWPSVKLDGNFLKLKDEPVVKKVEALVVSEIKELDLTNKPGWLSNCKYALSQGYFEAGTRDNSLTILAASYKSQGFPEEVVYGMLRGVAAIQARRHNSTPFADREIKRIVASVYDDLWRGGTYTCKTEGPLKEYCDSHGFNCQKIDDEYPVVEVSESLASFDDYAKNIENNTVRTGIKELDDKLRFQIGHLNGFLAPPGIGKTSMALTILNNTAVAGLNSLFFSYDMSKYIMIQKIIQRETGYNDTQIFEIFKSDNAAEKAKIEQIFKDNYSNVGFCFKSGQTIKGIKNSIKYREDKTGQAVKLVVVDYLELIQSQFSDPTQASMENIQGLREIANEMDKAVLVLLQPNKVNSKPDEPLLGYTAAKGSSAVGQAVTAMITAHRPGYNPREPEKDKFFSIDVVKNRMGPLFSLDFHWEGPTGKIRSLSPTEKHELKTLRAKKEMDKNDDGF